MKNKLLLSLILVGLVLALSLPAQAFFVKSHISWITRAMESVDSPITELCKDKVDLVIDGNVAADVPVIHYYDKNAVFSYISTHTRGSGYQACIDNAGSDTDLRCFCIGLGTHIVQDDEAHTNNVIPGLVPKYIEQYFGSNLFSHMVIERDFENKHMAYLATDPTTTTNIETYNGMVLDNLFAETGGNPKYLELLKTATAIDMTQDAQVFRSGYKGEGFYNSVYKDKVSLPWWTWAVGIGMIILGLTLMIITLVWGKTWYKWLNALQWLIILLIGALIVYGFAAGNIWQMTTAVIEVPPAVGMYSVTDNDIKTYDNMALQETERFFKTGIVDVDDASGLSYTDKSGNRVEGALNKADSKFRTILFPIMLIFYMFFNIWLFYKTFKRRS